MRDSVLLLAPRRSGKTSVKFRKETASVALVDECYERLLGPDRRKHFAHWEERLDDPLASPGERSLVRKLLNAAAKDPDGIEQSTVTQLRSTLGTGLDLDTYGLLLGLQHDGYLVKVDGRWRYASSLLREWWLRWKVSR